MKAQLVHLSGPFRGETITYAAERVRIGSSAECEVRFPDAPPVAPDHAEIIYAEERCCFHLRRVDGQVFVNQREVAEVILAYDDLIEFGTDGPTARFRIATNPTSVCKPVRQMLGDARDVGTYTGIRGFTGSLSRDLFRHATWQLKVFFPLGVIGLILGISFVAGRMGATSPVSDLENQIRARDRHAAEDVARVRREFADFQTQQEKLVSKDEVDSLRKELALRATRIDRLAETDEALRRIMNVFTKGVCIVHGIYAYRSADPGRAWLTDTSGERVEVEYFGSAFLVSAAGDVITNHHVAQPWWHDDKTEAAGKLGFKPEFVRLDVCFPGRPPTTVDPKTVRLRSDDLDVATFRITPDPAVPVLPLSTSDPMGLRGQHCVVLGYPTGISAILARAEPELARAVTSNVVDLTGMLAALAQRGAVSPVATQGALNDVLEYRLVYDAGTTSGGSGGPVFGVDGTVIGVNFAILREFGGSNFGVPIRFAAELVSLPESAPASQSRRSR